jgi:hypothetical protein
MTQRRKQAAKPAERPDGWDIAMGDLAAEDMARARRRAQEEGWQLEPGIPLDPDDDPEDW